MASSILQDLARLVGSMADSVETEAEILDQLVQSHTTYVSATRAILTGGEIPASPNPGEGGAVAIPRDVAVGLTTSLAQNVASSVQALAQRGDARAKELDAVRKKEEEEKQDGTPSGPSTPGRTPDGGGGGSPASPGSTAGANGQTTAPGEKPEETPQDEPKAPRVTGQPRRRVRAAATASASAIPPINRSRTFTFPWPACRSRSVPLPRAGRAG